MILICKDIKQDLRCQASEVDHVIAFQESSSHIWSKRDSIRKRLQKYLVCLWARCSEGWTSVAFQFVRLSDQLSSLTDRIFDGFNSAYRKRYSCETTLVRLVEDQLEECSRRQTDSGCVINGHEQSLRFFGSLPTALKVASVRPLRPLSEPARVLLHG